jgi:hypothetical protein
MASRVLQAKSVLSNEGRAVKLMTTMHMGV